MGAAAIASGKMVPMFPDGEERKRKIRDDVWCCYSGMHAFGHAPPCPFPLPRPSFHPRRQASWCQVGDDMTLIGANAREGH